MSPRLEKLKTIVLKAGQPLTIETTYRAEPEPTAQWLFEGQPLTAENNERLSISMTDKSVKLVVTNTKRADTGKYTIKLTNVSGSDSTSCDVTILCKLLRSRCEFNLWCIP